MTSRFPYNFLDTGTITWRSYSAAALLITVLIVGLSFSYGQDINWDQISYHYYAGYVALTGGRFAQDYFAASIQSYLVPYSFIPFYLLVSSGVAPFAVSAALAAVHAINLIVVYSISRILLQREVLGSLWVWFAVTLAALSPIFLSQVGSSFNDILTSIPILAAVHIIVGLEASRAGKRVTARSLLAGILLGVSAGLKLTAVPFVLGGAVALVFLTMRAGGKRVIAGQAALWGGVVAGFAVTAGWWMAQLWKHFGNPVFPMMNHLFRSPHFTTENFTHERFLPTSFNDWMLLPFRMALPSNNIYTETAAPDGRFAAIIVFGFGLVYLIIRRRIAIRAEAIALFLFFAASYVGWSLTSANGRYLMPLLILAGPVAVTLIVSVVRSSNLRAYLAGTVLLVQAVGLALGADKRWGASGWSDTWFELEVPVEFKNERGLYISVDHQPAAFLAPYAHPQSGFVNAIGQYSLTKSGESANTLLKMLNENASRSWATFSVTMEKSNGEPSWSRDLIASRLKSLGMELTGEPCRFVLSRKLGADRILERRSGEIVVGSGLGFRRFAQCPVRTIAVDVAFLEEFRSREAGFRALERDCPALLRPSGVGIYSNGRSWEAVYVSTDTMIRLVNEQFFLSSYHNFFVPIDRRPDGVYVCPVISPRQSTL